MGYSLKSVSIPFLALSLVNTPHVTNYNPSHWLKIYVPQNVVQVSMYHKYHICGTLVVHGVVVQKIHIFVAYLKKKLKNLTTPIFLVGLIYRWGKGPKTKKYMYKCDFFLHNM